MKLTKEMQAQANALFLAQAADAAAPYRELANSIAVLTGARSKVAEKATEIKEGLWGAFRSALSVGLTANHSADNIAVGLTVACEDAGVPGGSSRSYIGTIRNMYAEIVSGGPLTLEDALLMKVKDARARYMDADKKALKEARERLAEATKDWTVAMLDEYTALANADNEARRAEKEAAKAQALAA